MTGSAVPVLDVWTKKKISIEGEGSGERGAIAALIGGGWRMTGSAVPVLNVWTQKKMSI